MKQRAVAPEELEQAIVDCLRDRAATATACPSEIARAVAPEAWRPLMPFVREAAARLAGRGMLLATQGGQPVDAACARGPIRLRLVRVPAPP